RWSLSDQNRTQGRERYPTDQGCLGTAWRTVGESSVVDLPSPLDDLNGWCAVLRDNWGIPDAVSTEFRMKSRTYVALAIRRKMTPCQGVIVFESEQLPAPG